MTKSRGEYIEPSDSKTVIADLGSSWITRQTHLKPSAFRSMESAWRILSNPARGVSLPRKVRREHSYLTHEQVHALADASGEYRTLVLLLAYSGLRWGEATGLRVENLDFVRRRLTVAQNAVTLGRTTYVGTPKTHHRRTVPVPAFLVEDLARHCDGKGRDDLVFRAPMGGYMQQPNGTRGWFDKAWKSTSVPRLTPHDLRYTAASLAVSAGCNVKIVQRMLGQASAAMTLDVYADLFSDDLEAVGVAMDGAARAQVGAISVLSRPQNP